MIKEEMHSLVEWDANGIVPKYRPSPDELETARALIDAEMANDPKVVLDSK